MSNMIAALIRCIVAVVGYNLIYSVTIMIPLTFREGNIISLLEFVYCELYKIDVRTVVPWCGVKHLYHFQ